MSSIPAGAKVRASVINAALPILGYASADTSKTSTTTLGDAAGMLVALEANSLYMWDAYLAYDAGATGDLKAAWSVPSGTTGHWSLWGVSTASTGSIGDLVAIRAGGYGSGNALAVGGSASFSGFLAARAAGYIDTAGSAGNFQLQVAQNSSNGTPTILKTGSWIRAMKVG